MSKVGVAVIGCGYWGPNLIRNFAENPDCRLVIVCDKKTSRLIPIHKRYPSVASTENVEEVLQNPEVQAVAIATPVSSHFHLARRALESGKHVLVEKPLATSAREAQILVNLAERKLKVLLAGHTFIYSPPVLKVKELLEKKVLGNIYYMDFSRVNLGLFQPDTNVLWDLSPHDVSIALFWLGMSPVSVRAEAQSFVRKRIEEVGYLSIKFPRGILVHCHVSWLAPTKLRRVVIVGSKKMLVYDDTENIEKVKIYNEGVVKNPQTFGEFQLTYRSGDVLSPKIPSYEPLSLECADFIRCIRTGGKAKSGGLFGLQVVKVLEASEKSLRLKGAPVRV